MANKVVVSVASVIIVLGCVVGVILLLANNGRSRTAAGSTSSKIGDVVCNPTEYKESCLNAIDEVAKNTSATPQDYIIAVIRQTAAELNKGLEKAVAAQKDLGSGNKQSKAELESCQKMIGYATDELQQVLKVVSETKASTIAQQTNPLLDWLTAIRAYQTSARSKVILQQSRQHALQAILKQTSYQHLKNTLLISQFHLHSLLL